MGQSASVTGGFRVFKVQKGSPAEVAGLLPFFDFIIEIGGKPMTPHQQVFSETIKEHENTRVKLVVYSTLTQSLRDLHVTPRIWSESPGLIGATVRWDAFEAAEDQSIRILEVFPNSPASDAGLQPHSDYLLGTTTGVAMTSIDDLKALLEDAPSATLITYNSVTQTQREVTLVPNPNWGGQGVIGADMRTGMLHHVPVITRDDDADELDERELARRERALQSPEVPCPPPVTPLKSGSSELLASPSGPAGVLNLGASP
jgi:S1-C subfamily serine protease